MCHLEAHSPNVATLHLAQVKEMQGLCRLLILGATLDATHGNNAPFLTW